MTTYYTLISYENTDQGYRLDEVPVAKDVQTLPSSDIKRLYRTYRFMEISYGKISPPSYVIDVIRLVPYKHGSAGYTFKVSDFWNYISTIQLTWVDEHTVLEAMARYYKFVDPICYLVEKDPHVFLNKIMAILPMDREGTANINSFVGSLTV